jgi:hypothetical protein
MRGRRPVEGALRHRLRAAVEHERVVHRARAEAVAQRRLHRVGAVPGSTSRGSPAAPSVTASASACAWPPLRKPCRPAIEDEVRRPASHDGVPRRLGGGGAGRVADGPLSAPPRVRRRAGIEGEPGHRFGHGLDPQVGTVEEVCRPAERDTGIGRMQAVDGEQFAAVVVADERQPSARVGHAVQPRGHAIDDRRQGLRRVDVLGHAGDGERQGVEVERVAVIVRRALGVRAIGQHLPRALLEQHAAAEAAHRALAASSGSTRPQTYRARPSPSRCVFGLKYQERLRSRCRT